MLINCKVLEINVPPLFQAATEPWANVDTKGTERGRREIATIGRAERAQVTNRQTGRKFHHSEDDAEGDGDK